MRTVQDDQADGLRRLMAPAGQALAGTGGVIGLIGATSHCGTTTVACNLAAALAAAGRPVMYADEHRRSGTMPVWQLPYRGHWSQLQGRRDEACVQHTHCGVRAVAAAPMIGAAMPHPSAVAENQLVVIDADVSGGTLSDLMQTADVLIMVISPDKAAIEAAYARIKLLHFLTGMKKLSVILNYRTDRAQSEVDTRLFSNLAIVCNQYLGLSLKLIGNLPYDRHVTRQNDLRSSVTEAFPRSTTAVEIRKLSKDLITLLRPAIDTAERGFIPRPVKGQPVPLKV